MAQPVFVDITGNSVIYFTKVKRSKRSELCLVLPDGCGCKASGMDAGE